MWKFKKSVTKFIHWPTQTIQLTLFKKKPLLTICSFFWLSAGINTHSISRGPSSSSESSKVHGNVTFSPCAFSNVDWSTEVIVRLLVRPRKIFFMFWKQVPLSFHCKCSMTYFSCTEIMPSVRLVTAEESLCRPSHTAQRKVPCCSFGITPNRQLYQLYPSSLLFICLFCWFFFFSTIHILHKPKLNIFSSRFSSHSMITLPLLPHCTMKVWNSNEVCQDRQNSWEVLGWK